VEVQELERLLVEVEEVDIELLGIVKHLAVEHLQNLEWQLQQHPILLQ
jgi:hypothetical protein